MSISKGAAVSPDYLAEDNAPYILAIMGAACTAAFFTTILRLYVRQFKLNGIKADDTVIAIATMFSVTLYALFCVQAPYGLGRHVEAITMDQTQEYQRLQFWTSMTMITSMACVKISILLLLRRLVPARSFQILAWTFIVFLIVYAAASNGTVIFACIPVNAYWNFEKKPSAKCFSPQTYISIGLSHSIVTIVTDVVLAIIPMPIIWRLQIAKSQKIVLCAVLALGLFAVAAGIQKVRFQLVFPSTPDQKL
ncbi:Hypothetical protein D9617_119g039680 [Elsinoe fawcettii]|nr:Hypothetical protein D9617_119g039680 [Elsinoe fawcettii]